MPNLLVRQIPCLTDNYGYLIHDPDAGHTATIDTPEVGPINAALAETGWTLTHIMNTHHHFDHAGGNEELKKKWHCTVIGSRKDSARIPGIDNEVGDGDKFRFGNHDVQVFDVSGHTIGHIAFYFAEAEKLFCGDALFALGCGRLFEGTPDQMWTSLQKLIELPDNTGVYCAHEYTESNLRWANNLFPEDLLIKERQQAELMQSLQYLKILNLI